MRLIMVASFAFIMLCLCQCTVEDDDPISEPLIVECLEYFVPKEWHRHRARNNYYVSTPRFYTADYLSAGVSHASITMGHCQLFAITDFPPCADFHAYHPFDSISINPPDSVMIEGIEIYGTIPLRQTFCRGDSIYGALYLRDIDPDRSMTYGKLYLDFKGNDYLHFGSEAFIDNNANYDNNLDSLIMIIQSMSLNETE